MVLASRNEVLPVEIAPVTGKDTASWTVGGTLFSTSRSAYMFPETAVFPPIVRAPSHAVGGLP